MAKMVGTSLPLKVIEINRNRNRLILSERQAVQEAREGRKDELLSALKEGDVRTGRVTSVCDFGAFVDIGGADGLVHLSEISWSRVKHPSEVLKPGDPVQVYILSVDNERKRIALSIKRTQNEPWTTVSERYHLGQTVEGTITQLASFGAFARIEDGVEGLIHVSEMGDGRAQHPREVVQEGQQIQARIIRIDPQRKRMGLSMRQATEGEAPPEEHEASEAPPEEHEPSEAPEEREASEAPEEA
jgi:small subunit ribosomal protein S1